MLLHNKNAINVKKTNKNNQYLWKKFLKPIKIEIPGDPSSAAFLPH